MPYHRLLLAQSRRLAVADDILQEIQFLAAALVNGMTAIRLHA